MAGKQKKKMDKLVLFFIPIGVAINFVCGQIASNLALPFYLDTIGTILAGALCGSYAGMLTGLVGSIINGVAEPILFCFAPISMVVGLLAGQLSKHRFFKSAGKMVVSAVVLGLACGVISSVITWVVFGFNFGMGPSSYIAIPLYKILHLPKFICELIGSSSIDMIDKVISIIVVSGIFKAIPRRMLSKLPLGDLYVREKKEIVDLGEDEEDDETFWKRVLGE